MGWHYACKKVMNDWNEEEYTIVKVFPEIKAYTGFVSHTENTRFFEKTPEDLAKELRVAADDIEKHGCINEDDL